jgi:hypothetical protein
MMVLFRFSGLPSPKLIRPRLDRWYRHRRHLDWKFVRLVGTSTIGARQWALIHWYLERQLGYFKAAIRGGHPDDIYGDQMNLVAGVLKDENAIKDVIAYINTLR